MILYSVAVRRYECVLITTRDYYIIVWIKKKEGEEGEGEVVRCSLRQLDPMLHSSSSRSVVVLLVVAKPYSPRASVR